MAGTPAAIGRETVVRVCTDSEPGYGVLSAAREITNEIPVVETGSTGLHGLEPLACLTHELDPTARIPEYNVTSVRIAPVGPDPSEEPLPVDLPVEGAAEGGASGSDASASRE